MTFSIFPRTVYKTESKISGEVEVKEQIGNYTLHVGGLIQSGGIIEGIWKKALKILQYSNGPIFQNVLVLGLGGGTVVQLIKAHYPKAKITGIEIDPEIIKIGKKFFGLEKTENLKIINADAIKWAAGFQDSKFDLILVDLYIGGNFPEKVASDKFLKKLKKLLSEEGRIIFNRLISPSEDLAGFEGKLRRHFSSLEIIETYTNLLFLVS